MENEKVVDWCPSCYGENPEREICTTCWGEGTDPNGRMVYRDSRTIAQREKDGK